jgi:hypothetical protein
LRIVEYIDELYLKLILLKLKTVLRIVEYIDEFYLKLILLKLKTFIENS